LKKNLLCEREGGEEEEEKERGARSDDFNERNNLKVNFLPSEIQNQKKKKELFN